MSALSKKDVARTYPGRYALTPETHRLANLVLDQLWAERNSERLISSPDRSGSCKFAALLARELFGGRLAGNVNHVFVMRKGAILDLNLAQGDVVSLGDAAHHQDSIALLNIDYRESMASCLPRVKRWIRRFEELAPKSCRVECQNDLSI